MFQEARTHLFTVRDLLRFAVSQFNQHGLVFGQGTSNARDEAAYLILHALHLPLDELDPWLDARLLPQEIERTLDFIERRVAERVPAAYLTGEAWLGPYRFVVDRRVIVPRSLIAEPLQQAMAPWISDALAVRHVLDLCCGSGCLAIIAADMFPHAQVDAVDISGDALAVTRDNIALHGLEGRVTLIQSDLWQALPAQRYDLIVCNPPYVNQNSMEALPAEFRSEPQLALAGGTDGMNLVRRIIEGASGFLSADGRLVLEIGHERQYFEAAFPDLPCMWLSTSAGDDQVLMIEAADLSGRTPSGTAPA